VCAEAGHGALVIGNLQSAATHRDLAPVANESRERIQNNRTPKNQIDFLLREYALAKTPDRRQNVKRNG
jgi:hypothetical protein